METSDPFEPINEGRKMTLIAGGSSEKDPECLHVHANLTIEVVANVPFSLLKETGIPTEEGPESASLTETDLRAFIDALGEQPGAVMLVNSVNFVKVTDSDQDPGSPPRCIH